jgi:hypothetical protein
VVAVKASMFPLTGSAVVLAQNTQIWNVSSSAGKLWVEDGDEGLAMDRFVCG